MTRLKITVFLLLAVVAGLYAADGQLHERYFFQRPKKDEHTSKAYTFKKQDFNVGAGGVVTIPSWDPNNVPYADPNGDATYDSDFQYDPSTDTLIVNIIDANSFDVNDANVVGTLYFGDANTYITQDGSDNLTFTDAIVGTKTLKQLGSPTYIYIKATSQAEGNIHLSDATNWGVDKSLIYMIRIFTSSTDWELYLLQNDNGYAANDATIPMLQIGGDEMSGNANFMWTLPYEDEDASQEVHLYYLDNSGANTADIYIIGIECI